MRKMRVSWKFVLAAAVLTALLVSVFAATGVFASLGDTTKVITVKEGSVNCDVGQDYSIRNTGNVPVLLRAKVVVNWLDSDGNVLALAPAGAAVSVSPRYGWTHFPSDAEAVDDGYWYYTNVVEPNAKVFFIDNASFSGGNARIIVLAEVIQSAPNQAAADAWGMTYSNGVWVKK